MADNVAVTEGSGKTIATDDVGGAQYQRIKLDGGGDGSGTPVLAGGGAEASALRVTVANDSTGVLSVDDNGSSLTIDGTLTGITNSIAVHVLSTGGTIRVGDIPGSIGVFFSPSNPGVNITSIAAGDNNIGNVDIASGTLTDITNSIKIHLLSTGGTIGVRVGQIDGSASVYLSGTAGTLGVRVGQIDGTTSVYLAQTSGTVIVKVDPASTVLTNAAHTANIFTVSGSTSAISASGLTLVSPSANASFKVFAYSISTTGIVHMVPKFTNGAGTSPTEYWRVALQGPSGANLAVTPPGFLFATGVSTTLALLNNDAGSLIHYSVSYIKESA